MGIQFKQKGGFENTKKFFEHAKSNKIEQVLNKYGEVGVRALHDATPKATGKTADSWYYVVKHTNTGYSVEWCNSNKAGRGEYLVALLIQYGHGIRNHKSTRTGAYVKGIDYINPALKPVFDAVAADVWKEVQGERYY